MTENHDKTKGTVYAMISEMGLRSWLKFQKQKEMQQTTSSTVLTVT
jgi:hypothetical protein